MKISIVFILVSHFREISRIYVINVSLYVMSEHRLLLGHEFDWDHVEILDEEPYLGKRLVSEMLHINPLWAEFFS